MMQPDGIDYPIFRYSLESTKRGESTKGKGEVCFFWENKENLKKKPLKNYRKIYLSLPLLYNFLSFTVRKYILFKAFQSPFDKIIKKQKEVRAVRTLRTVIFTSYELAIFKRSFIIKNMIIWLCFDK